MAKEVEPKKQKVAELNEKLAKANAELQAARWIEIGWAAVIKDVLKNGKWSFFNPKKIVES